MERLQAGSVSNVHRATSAPVSPPFPALTYGMETWSIRYTEARPILSALPHALRFQFAHP
jgi:hypothetical protein